MKDFEYAYDVLLKVIEENIPFNLAVISSLKKAKDVHAALKSNVSVSAAVTLRHYYVFKEIFTRNFGEVKENKFLLFALGMGNHLFSKRFDEEELFAFIEKDIELDGVIELIKQFDDPHDLIPTDIEQNSDKYLSLKYNVPMWMIRMWRKSIGPVGVKKVLRQLYAPNRFVRISTNKIGEESFYQKYDEFEPFEGNKKVALFKGEHQLRKSPAVTSGDALMLPAVYFELCSNLDIDPIRGIAIYSTTANQLLEELYSLFGKDIKLDYVCGEPRVFFEVNNKIKQFGMKNVSIYECKASSMITCLSKPVHTLFVCPKNSNYSAFAEKPDFFLTVKQEDLDGYINDEYNALIEACSQIEDGGDLVYFIPTYCKNESQTVVQRFLENATNFTLVKERQILPFSNYQAMFYYAILRKENKND